jgi:hypothetical protein
MDGYAQDRSSRRHQGAIRDADNQALMDHAGMALGKAMLFHGPFDVRVVND